MQSKFGGKTLHTSAIIFYSHMFRSYHDSTFKISECWWNHLAWCSMISFSWNISIKICVNYGLSLSFLKAIHVSKTMFVYTHIFMLTKLQWYESVIISICLNESHTRPRFSHGITTHVLSDLLATLINNYRPNTECIHNGFKR